MYPPLCGGELDIRSHLGPPRGVPIPQTAPAGPKGLGCIRRCVWGGGGWKKANIRPPPRGIPIPQTAHEGLKRPGVYPPLCGEELGMYPPAPPPRGVPTPQTAHAWLEGLGCNCRYVGRNEECTHLGSPLGVPIPQIAQARGEGLGCMRHFVGGELEIRSYPAPPRGIPIPQTAQSGQQGLRCICRCVGRNWKSDHIPPTPGASLSPKQPKQDRGASGVSAPVGGGGGRDWRSALTWSPCGASRSAIGLGRYGGTRAYRRYVGSNWKTGLG